MITQEDVKKVARLAKLTMSEAETELYTVQLGNIMEMIDDMLEVDCTLIEPLRSVCEMTPNLREDKITETNISNQLFMNAPGKDAAFAKEIKCFIVPKVIE